MNNASVTHSNDDPAYEVSTSSYGYGTRSVDPPASAAITASTVIQFTDKPLGPQQLYSELDDSLRSHVSSLVQEARRALDQARQIDASSEFIQFDQNIMLARSFVGRALNCRQLGQGFTAVVNGVNWALANRREVSPTKKQLSALISALDRIIWSPYLHFDSAMPILARIIREAPACVVLYDSFGENVLCSDGDCCMVSKMDGVANWSGG
jgi:hypothetical protein